MTAIGSSSALHALLAEVIAGLTPSEQGELLRLLTKLGEALVPRPPQPAPVPVRRATADRSVS